jgi:serine/threonine-protein kinase
VTIGPDDLLDGKYRIRYRIGSGGMGEVWEAEHEFLRRPVAIKVLSAALADDEGAVRRFFREARAAAGIGHENICEVTDVGRAPDGSPYLVLPRLVGRSLAAALAEDGPFPPPRAVAVLSQVLAALEAAHARGIVHRDLKPDNVFLTRVADREDFVKLLDFGICKVRPAPGRPTTATDGLPLGTPAYMAPEQLAGEADERSDVWAVGVMAYELLTGRRPVAPEERRHVIPATATRPVPPPGVRRPGVPPALDALVLRAIERDPQRRFPTAAAFHDALRAVLDGGAAAPLPAAPSPPPSSSAVPTVPDTPLRAAADAASPEAEPAEPPAEQVAPAASEVVPASPDSASSAAAGSSLPAGLAASSSTSPAPPWWRSAFVLLAGALVLAGGAATAWFLLGGPGREPSRAARVAGSAGVGAPPVVPPVTLSHVPNPCPAGMVHVPAGPVQLGSPLDDARPDEQPVRTLELPAFCIDRDELTNRAWRKCVEAGACAVPDCGPRPGYGPDEQPVTCVDWHQAAAYCAWRGARLPGEWEWEKAARGGCELVAPAGCGPEDLRTFPWGDAEPDCDHANRQGCLGRADPVGLRRAGDGPYGTHDTAGNAAEWTADWSGPPCGPGTARECPDAPGESERWRGVRGGSWDDPPRWLRVSRRGRLAPDGRDPVVGLRCALTPGAPPPSGGAAAAAAKPLAAEAEGR